jgi:hypothetical protein
MDSSMPDDDSGGGPQDYGSSTDSGSSTMDSSIPPPPTDSGVGAVCPNTLYYAAEAVLAVKNGPTICAFNVNACSASECCYEQANPLSVCVAK